MKNVAIVGQGVIGVSTALAIKETLSRTQVTLFSDKDFVHTCSFGPAGLFRLDDCANKEWARVSFERFAEIERTHGPRNTGVKLLSGHIQSDNRALLENAERSLADVVYNFRWLSDREIYGIHPTPSKYSIHYTAYATEGRIYVPWMMEQLRQIGGTDFKRRELQTLEELVTEDQYDVIVNCAGLNGGKLAGDDNTCYPVRGVAIEVRAPWHKHFNYRDVDSFTIPMNDSVILGTLKQTHRSDMEITDEDRREIWEKYLKLHPTFKDAEAIGEWIGLRPARPSVRLEKVTAKSASGKKCYIIHNYGHGSNGFTMSWGCAMNVLGLMEEEEKD